MTEIRFNVAGLPIAQGSKRIVPTAQGPRAVEGNEKKLKPWRQEVAAAARAAANEVDIVFVGPVVVFVSFYFPRPKAHYGTGKNANVLKQGAPQWKATAPDIDKLVRSLLDGLTASGVVRDDAQVVAVTAKKMYGSPGAWVTLRAPE